MRVAHRATLLLVVLFCRVWPARALPLDLPDLLRDKYTLGGSVPVESFLVDDTGDGEGTHYKFPKAVLDKMLLHARNRIEFHSQLGDRLRQAAASFRRDKREQVYAALVLHQDKIRGKDCLVFGSMEPWAEAALLVLDAKTVTTVEYNRLTYEHPQITTIHGGEFPALYSGTRKFDCALSLSAFDHDGLGRYGDPLNPEGDLLAMKRVKSVLSPSGFLFLTVPLGPDVLVWNLHRRYGQKRLPLLLEGFRVIDTVAGLDDWPIGRNANVSHDQAVVSSPKVAELLTSPANYRQTIEPIFVLCNQEVEPLHFHERDEL